MRHGYKTMGFAIQKFGKQNHILWSCPKTGDVIEEMPLGEVSNEPGRVQEEDSESS